jgi:putative transposase
LAVDSAFSRAEKRRLTHKGIEYDSLLYNSQDLRVIREKFGSEIDVEVRVMDDDLGSLVVVVPGGEQLVRVPALEIEYAQGLTRWQHRICKRHQRRLYDDTAKVIELYDAKERIRRLIADDMGWNKNRKSRKRHARFMEGLEDRPPAAVARPPPVSLLGGEANAVVFPPPAASFVPIPIEDEIPAMPSRRKQAY